MSAYNMQRAILALLLGFVLAWAAKGQEACEDPDAVWAAVNKAIPIERVVPLSKEQAGRVLAWLSDKSGADTVFLIKHADHLGLALGKDGKICAAGIVQDTKGLFEAITGGKEI